MVRVNPYLSVSSELARSAGSNRAALARAKYPAAAVLDHSLGAADEEARVRADQVDHMPGQLKNGVLSWIPDIHRAGDLGARSHQPYQPLDEIVNVAEGSSLQSIPLDSVMSRPSNA